MMVLKFPFFKKSPFLSGGQEFGNCMALTNMQLLPLVSGGKNMVVVAGAQLDYLLRGHEFWLCQAVTAGPLSKALG